LDREPLRTDRSTSPTCGRTSLPAPAPCTLHGWPRTPAWCSVLWWKHPGARALSPVLLARGLLGWRWVRRVRSP